MQSKMNQVSRVSIWSEGPSEGMLSRDPRTTDTRRLITPNKKYRVAVALQVERARCRRTACRFEDLNAHRLASAPK